jgi:hypothetical protein
LSDKPFTQIITPLSATADPQPPAIDPPFSADRARSVALPDLQNELAAARPGDVLVVNRPTVPLRTAPVVLPGGFDGDEPDRIEGIELRGSGAPGNPVWVAAEDPDSLDLAGVNILVSGAYVNLWGLRSEDATLAATGAGVRILRHTFGPTPGDGAAIMLSSPECEVGYCLIHDVRKWGIRCRTPDAARVRIHHCFFRDAQGKQGDNGHEMVQLGLTRGVALTDMHMTLEDTLFQDCAVDLECVSLKSWGNIVRRNTLIRSSSISNRHGRHNRIVGNTLVDSRILLLGGPGVCAWNQGIGKATIEPVWGTIKQADSDKGVEGYPACADWNVANNDGLKIKERNPGDNRKIKPTYTIHGDSGPKVQAKRLMPADVGPGAK